MSLSGRTQVRTLVLLTVAVIVIDIGAVAAFALCWSWPIALVEMLASALFGLFIVGYLFWHYRLEYLRSPSPDLQWNGVLLFMAAVMLIMPGPMSDAIGGLLLLPPLRRLLVRWLLQ